MTKSKALDKAKLAVEPNYITFVLQYNKQLVLPYKAGIQMLEALQQAERLSGYSSEEYKISPCKDELQIQIISRADYLDYKMNYLMRDTSDE